MRLGSVTFWKSVGLIWRVVVFLVEMRIISWFRVVMTFRRMLTALGLMLLPTKSGYCLFCYFSPAASSLTGVVLADFLLKVFSHSESKSLSSANSASSLSNQTLPPSSLP